MKLQLVSETSKDLSYYESSSLIAKKIAEIIENRFENSKVRKYDGVMFVYLFFNYDVINNNHFEKRSDCFYIGKSSSFDSNIMHSAFFTTSSCAVLASIQEIPKDIKSVVIYYSLEVIDKYALFGNIEKKSEDNISFVTTTPKYTFEDVVINEDEKHAIFRALTIIKEKKLLFEKWQYNKIDPSSKSILCFHGAPGTGKTMCAHAVANYLGKKLLVARYSQIQSKYSGEGEKNLRRFFETAEREDAVLFIDEADTFLSKRLSSTNSNSKIYNSMSNELFQLIEDYNGCIVFASNLVTDFDPAIISRIIEPIEFKLPDYKTRTQIIKQLLPPAIPYLTPITELDFAKLASISEGFSGRDIRKATLIFLADKLYIEKELNHKKDDEILFTIDDMIIGFENVRDAKKKLNDAINHTNKVVGNFIKEEEQKLRILQVSALALWADGNIAAKERLLFEQLSKEFKIDFPINDRSKIPSLEEICKNVHLKSEKLQLIDAACRMIAFDSNCPDSEKEFLYSLLNTLGFRQTSLHLADTYIDSLIKSYNLFGHISNEVEISSCDAIDELKKEYTEGAAYYHLAEMYRDGSDFMGGIEKNQSKADYYFKLAKESGYVRRRN